MKKLYLLGSLLLCLLHGHAQTDSVSRPALWLRADKSQPTGTSWSDVSQFKRDAKAGSIQQLPASNGIINFNKAVVFDGVDDYLNIPYSLEGLTDLSILAVFESADTTERGIWGTEQGISRNIFLTTRKAMGPDTALDAYGKNERLVVLNSVIQNWEKGTALSSNAFFALGSAGRSRTFKPFKGSLAELIIFGRALTFTDRIKYETYLSIKYGTGLKGPNMLSSSNQLLWRGTDNKGYAHNIAGIGRDDHFELFQKQSASAYDSGLLLLSIAPVTTLNSENSGLLADQNFLVWGDNGRPLLPKKGLGIDSILSIVDRKWLITVSGTSMSTKPVDMYMEANRLPAASDGYWLVIDRSGNGNFAVDNLEYISADRIENGKIVYKNIVWDKDGSGKDNFGFAIANDLFAVVRNLAKPSCLDEDAGKVRIEVIAGKGPFEYRLNGVEGEIKREWRATQFTSEQGQLKKGDYTLNLADKSGNELIRHFHLTMPDALNISLGPDQSLDPAKDIVLDVSHQVPDSVEVSYRWENSFGFSSEERRIVAKEAGVYRVYVTKKSDGCVFSDDVAITGSDEQRIAVYPNIVAVNDVVNIGVSLEKTSSVTVRLFDSRGIVITELKGSGNAEYLFNVSFKESGMYLVVIQTQGGFETRKVVVQ